MQDTYKYLKRKSYYHGKNGEVSPLWTQWVSCPKQGGLPKETPSEKSDYLLSPCAGEGMNFKCYSCDPDDPCELKIPSWFREGDERDCMTGCPVENKVNDKPSREYPRARWVRVCPSCQKKEDPEKEAAPVGDA